MDVGWSGVLLAQCPKLINGPVPAFKIYRSDLSPKVISVFTERKVGGIQSRVT